MAVSGTWSVGIPWTALEEILACLHGATSEIDFNLHAYTLLQVQGLYRQAVCGKAGRACFRSADTHDCPLVNLAGGKSDQYDEHGYGKRMACNFEDAKFCFPTALARHFFSRTLQDNSPYLFMGEEDAERYKRQLNELKDQNASREHPLRIRDNGPHTKFRRQFARAIKDLPLGGISKQGITLHSLKRVGYRQVRRLPGIEAQDVSARADHHSTLAYAYAGRSAPRKSQPGGGPDDTKDYSMAKALANLRANTIEFNRFPPHFSPEFSATIPFHAICPCYAHLSDDEKQLLPLLLAQLVNHYHSPAGLAQLGHDNPLRSSPLWAEPRWIEYREVLHRNLLGGHNARSAFKSQLRDPGCDSALQFQQILKNQAVTLVKSEDASEKRHALETYNLLAEITGEDVSQQQPEATHIAFCARQPAFTRAASQATEQGPTSADVHPQQGSFFQLPQAPPPFKIPSTLNVREAWFRFFRREKWINKTVGDIDGSVTGAERKSMRDLFNKCKHVIHMMLGTNTVKDVDKLECGASFNLAHRKIISIWQQDILSEHGGYRAVRSVYNIMTGDPTTILRFNNLTSDSCKDLWKQCNAAAWTRAPSPIQSRLNLAPAPHDNHTLASDGDMYDNQTSHECPPPIQSSPGGASDDIIDIDDSHSNDDPPVFDQCSKELGVECFVCTKCNPKWLTPDFNKFIQHVKKSHSQGRRTVQLPMEDEVPCVWGHKMSVSRTSPYTAAGLGQHYKQFTQEERLQFLRKRILHRHILQANDRIVIQQEHGTAVGLVLDPTLVQHYNVWCVKQVLYRNDACNQKQNDPVSIELNSILAIESAAPPSRPRAMTSSSQQRSKPPASPDPKDAEVAVRRPTLRMFTNPDVLCPINSLIIAWFHVCTIREAVLQESSQNPLVRNLQRVFQRLQTDQTRFSLQNFVTDLPRIIRREARLQEVFVVRGEEWTQNLQADISEFYVVLVEYLDGVFASQLKNKDKKPKPFISLFRGSAYYCTEYANGRSTNGKSEPFYIQALHLNDNIDLSLSDLGKPESLDEALKTVWGMQQGTRRLIFETLPQVLHINLKRQDNKLQKSTARFSFSDTLTINYGTQNETQFYHLHSVLVHKGTANAGHYYAFIRPEWSGNKWYKFDDLQQSVEEVSRADAIDANFGGEGLLTQPTAYMLIYVQQSHETQGPTRPQLHPTGLSSAPTIPKRRLASTFDRVLPQSLHDSFTFANLSASQHKPDISASGPTVPALHPTTEHGSLSSAAEVPTPYSGPYSPRLIRSRIRAAAIGPNTSKQASAATSQSQSFNTMSRARGQRGVECTPLSDSDAQLDIGAIIMLRDVAQLGTCLRSPLMPVPKFNCNTPTVGIPGGVKFPIFLFQQAAFIDDDYGMTFTGVYPDHVQKVLDAFQLNETNRCFFLALGIGTNTDPFLLQCLFRRHALYMIQNKAVLLNSSGGDADATGQLLGSIDSEFESLQNVMEPGSSIDCSVLRYLWPIEFNNFQIVVICKRYDRQQVARYIVVVFNSSNTDDGLIQASQDVERKQTIFLKLENCHYTLLTLVQGSLDLSDAHHNHWFAHDINEGLRCPSITTMHFQETVFPEAYVASAVDGTVPSAAEVDSIWQRLAAHHGIKFGQKGEWLQGIPKGVATTNENQQGSIDAASFNNVRNALLNALEAKDMSPHSTTTSSSLRLSRSAPSVSEHASASCVHAPQLRASVPCVFLDLGSESGRALVRMLHDNRITHAAGVEHQASWFQFSVELFKQIRQEFVHAQFRMPAITIFRSCMLQQTPQLAYMYAIASIAYMNNEVFDKAKVSNPLLHRLARTDPAKKDLSANAAYALSKRFQNRTCIAVFKVCGLGSVV